jgi:hypothetical protein
MSTPPSTGATAGGNVLGWPELPDAANPPPEEPEYVFWYHTGEESVFYYPPGSIQEHLVTEHGIDSPKVRRHAMGHHQHRREHSRQSEVHVGGVGELLVVGHAHEEAA